MKKYLKNRNKIKNFNQKLRMIVIIYKNKKFIFNTKN